MDLREYDLSSQQIMRAKEYFAYQPFIISDTVESGIAYDWATGRGIFLMDREKVSADEFKRFKLLNGALREIYDNWIDIIVHAYDGNVSQATAIDTACAEGYFLHTLKRKGVGRCIGYDLDPRMAQPINFLNEITQNLVEFVNEPYDMRTHMIKSAAPAEIVISSAIMLHLSDPAFYLEFLGNMTKNVLFIFSTFEESEDFRISYESPRLHHDKNAKFPLCFSGRTVITTGLLKFGLVELGFKEILEIPPENHLIPIDWNLHKAFLAVR